MPRTQAPPRRVTPKPTDRQCDWIRLRDSIGWQIDFYLITEPSPPMREVVRQLEDLLADGDRAAGLLEPNGHHSV